MDKNILNRIKIQVKKSYYAFERYQTASTFALLYHEQPLNVVELSNYVRISDHLIEIDEHHYFITFSHTSQNNAYKASQNLVLSLDHHFNDQTTAIAIDQFDASSSAQIVINRLNQILQEARRSPISRIEDETALDERI